MPLTLYFSSPSGPSRACLLLARYLNLEINVKHINLGAGEHLSPEYLKVNPFHKVPALVDGEYVLTESRAILAYLINSRKPGSDLYPTEPKARGLVDHRLYYDSGNVFDKLAGIVVSFYLLYCHEQLAKISQSQSSVVFRKNKTISQEQKDGIRAVLKVLNDFLETNEYMAGKKLTIADFSIIASVSVFFVSNSLVIN